MSDLRRLLFALVTISSALGGLHQAKGQSDPPLYWPAAGMVIADFTSNEGTGINIDAPEGAPVHAVANGVVIYVGDGVEGYGNLILLRHPNDYVSAYAHLQEIEVDRGSNVMRGDTIATVGHTGNVSHPQLHFELRKGATPVDPILYLPSSEGSPSNPDNPGEIAVTDPQSAQATTEDARRDEFDPSDPVLVAKIQRGLGSLGFLHGAIDGVAGKATEKAIRSFEVYHNYEITGRITEDLLERLVEAGAVI